MSYPYQALLPPQSCISNSYHLLVTSITTPYQLSSSPMIYLCEVIALCTFFKSLVTLWFQLLLSLRSIYFPKKILFLGIAISYSSLTYASSTPNRYPIRYFHQQLVSPSYTVAVHTTPYKYSFQLFLAATPCYSYQLPLSDNHNIR